MNLRLQAVDEPAVSATDLTDEVPIASELTPEEALTIDNNAHPESEVLKDETVDPSSTDDNVPGATTVNHPDTQHQTDMDPETVSVQQLANDTDAKVDVVDSTDNNEDSQLPSAIEAIEGGVDDSSEAAGEQGPSHVQAADVEPAGAKQSGSSASGLESNEILHATSVANDEENATETQTPFAPSSEESVAEAVDSEDKAAGVISGNNPEVTSEDLKVGGVADAGQDVTATSQSEDAQPSTGLSESNSKETFEGPDPSNLSIDRQRVEQPEAAAEGAVNIEGLEEKARVDATPAVESAPDAASEPAPSDNEDPAAEVRTEGESRSLEDPSSQPPSTSLTEEPTSDVKSLNAEAPGPSPDGAVDIQEPSSAAGEANLLTHDTVHNDEPVSQVPGEPEETESEGSAIPVVEATADGNDSATKTYEPLERDHVEVDAGASLIPDEPSIESNGATATEEPTLEASNSAIQSALPLLNDVAVLEGEVAGVEAGHDHDAQESDEVASSSFTEASKELTGEANKVNESEETETLRDVPTTTLLTAVDESTASAEKEEDQVETVDKTDVAETTTEQESIVEALSGAINSQPAVDSSLEETTEEVPSSNLKSRLDAAQSVENADEDEVSIPPAADATEVSNAEAEGADASNSNQVEAELLATGAVPTAEQSIASGDHSDEVPDQKTTTSDGSIVEEEVQQGSNAMSPSDGHSSSTPEIVEVIKTVDSSKEVKNESPVDSDVSEESEIESAPVKTDVDSVSVIPVETVGGSTEQPGVGTDSSVETVEDALPDSASKTLAQDDSDEQSALDSGITSSSQDTSTDAESETAVVTSDHEDSSSTDDQSTVHDGEIQSRIVKEQVEPITSNDDAEDSAEVVKDAAPNPDAATESISPNTFNEATEAVTVETDKDPTSSPSHVVGKADVETVTPVISPKELHVVETHDAKSVGTPTSDSMSSSDIEEEEDLPQGEGLSVGIAAPEAAGTVVGDDTTESHSLSLEAKAQETGEIAAAVTFVESAVAEESTGVMAEPATQLIEVETHVGHDLPSDTGIVEVTRSDVELENATLTGSPEQDVSVDSVSSRDVASPKEDIGGQQDVGPLEALDVHDTAQSTDVAEQTMESQAKDLTTDQADETNVALKAVDGVQSHHPQPSTDSSATPNTETGSNNMLDPLNREEVNNCCSLATQY